MHLEHQRPERTVIVPDLQGLLREPIDVDWFRRAHLFNALNGRDKEQVAEVSKQDEQLRDSRYEENQKQIVARGGWIPTVDNNYRHY